MIIFTVDSFTSEAFSGNPAAVCILEDSISDELMQKIAAEMNLSETAFVSRNGSSFSLRWFSPMCEVDLCGHATLASAHILWQEGILGKSEKAVFETRGGILEAKKTDEKIEMFFPVDEPREVDCPDELVMAIHYQPGYVGKCKFDYLAVYENEKIIREIHPDLAHVKNLGSRGLIVSSKSDSDNYDFVSRFFGPNAGIDEDPVTGSAHCCLAPYWSKVLNKNSLTGYQASKRGGIVHTKLYNDKVILSGNAVTVMKSEILI